MIRTEQVLVARRAQEIEALYLAATSPQEQVKLFLQLEGARKALFKPKRPPPTRLETAEDRVRSFSSVKPRRRSKGRTRAQIRKTRGNQRENPSGQKKKNGGKGKGRR